MSALKPVRCIFLLPSLWWRMQQLGNLGEIGEFQVLLLHAGVIFSYGYEQRKNMKDVRNTLDMRKEREELTQKLATLGKAVVSSGLDPKDTSSNTVNDSGWSISKLATIAEQISKHKECAPREATAIPLLPLTCPTANRDRYCRSSQQNQWLTVTWFISGSNIWLEFYAYKACDLYKQLL